MAPPPCQIGLRSRWDAHFQIFDTLIFFDFRAKNNQNGRKSLKIAKNRCRKFLAPSDHQTKYAKTKKI